MKKWFKENLLWIILVPSLILLDQITKILAVKYLDHEVVFIKNFFSLFLTFNDGAAWNLLSDHPIILKLISVIACILIAVYYFLNRKNHHKLAQVGLIMVFSGAFGNGIDRILYGKVTDFINLNIFLPFNSYFPIFNIADMCVTFGAVIILISILFFEKDK